MYALGIISVLVALVAIAAGAYACFEVLPAYTAAASRHVDDASSTLMDSIHSTLNILIYTSIGLAVLSIIMGVWAFWKIRYPAGIVGVVFGVCGLVLAFMAMPQ